MNGPARCGMSRSSWVVHTVLLMISLIHCATQLALSCDGGADSHEEAQARKERFTHWMRDFAEATRIRLATGVDTRPEAELVSNPVFRYSDEERSIPDATLWVWTRQSRPVALQKVEGNNDGGDQRWTVCFCSLSEDLLSVHWPNERQYAARKPGLVFEPVPMAEAPAESARARTRQLRTLRDRFSGRLGVDDDGKQGTETRTMPRPIFEYVDPDTELPLGAIFGMSATGTNPDLLLIIEARRDTNNNPRWEYGLARMTSASLRVRLDDAEIWSEGFASLRNPVFDNWTFFFLPRDFK